MYCKSNLDPKREQCVSLSVSCHVQTCYWSYKYNPSISTNLIFGTNKAYLLKCWAIVNNENEHNCSYCSIVYWEYLKVFFFYLFDFPVAVLSEPMGRYCWDSRCVASTSTKGKDTETATRGVMQSAKHRLTWYAPTGQINRWEKQQANMEPEPRAKSGEWNK